MPNYYLSVLNKHIIQVENKNVGLKVGGGGGINIPLPPQSKKWGGGTMSCPPCPPASYASDMVYPLPIVYVFVQITRIALLQRTIPKFDALLPTLCLISKIILYEFNLNFLPKRFLKVTSICLIKYLVLGQWKNASKTESIPLQKIQLGVGSIFQSLRCFRTAMTFLIIL